MNILLADDDIVSRKVMTRMLEQIGYEVTLAENGQAAVDMLLAKDGPRMALLDWMMPGLDGSQVCRRIRSAQQNRYTYLALLTSRDSREDLVAGLDAGADDYLIKPCNPAELRARLRTGQRILRLEDTLIAAREAMRFRATHDALTAVWNRGSILEFLDGALRQDESLGVLLCDIDHFKQINDLHGHLSGDSVLRDVAARLRSAIRTGDGIGRYGGEEFLIVLRRCEAGHLVERAEQLRLAVEQRAFSANGLELAVTMSVGAAVLPADATQRSIESLLSLADAALYRAKDAGRNRVMLAASVLTASGSSSRSFA